MANKLIGYNLDLVECQFEGAGNKVLQDSYSMCCSSLEHWLGSAAAEYCHGGFSVERGIVSFSRQPDRGCTALRDTAEQGSSQKISSQYKNKA